jgi:hypothetical protein
MTINKPCEAERPRTHVKEETLAYPGKEMTVGKNLIEVFILILQTPDTYESDSGWGSLTFCVEVQATFQT